MLTNIVYYVIKYVVVNVLNEVHSTITGDFSKGVTPVLIPNTEVKTSSAEYTCLETSREPRSLPVFPKMHLFGGAFLFLKYLGNA